MLEQVIGAVCRFTDSSKVSSPLQLGPVLSSYPRTFFTERPALRAELRRWQDALAGGAGKASLMNQVFELLSAPSSAIPVLEQLQACERLAEQAAALLFVHGAECEQLARTVLRSLEWPSASAIRADMS